MNIDTVIDSVLAHSATMKASRKAAVDDRRGAKRRSKVEATAQRVAFWDETIRSYVESLRRLAAVVDGEIVSLGRLVPAYSPETSRRSRGSRS